MPEWLSWTDISFAVIVILAFAFCMKHCVRAQRKLRHVETAHTAKATGRNVEHAPAKPA